MSQCFKRTPRHLREARTGRGKPMPGRGRARQGSNRIITVRRKQELKYNKGEPQCLTDGMWFEYHALYRYPDYIYKLFPDDLKARRHRERKEYAERRNRTGNQVNSRLQSLQRELQLERQLMEIRSQNGSQAPAQITQDDQRSQVSEVTRNTAGMFGGGINRKHGNASS